MKKYLFLFLMTLSCVTFTACGDDEEEVLNPDNPGQVDVKVGKAEIKESANQLVLTYGITVQGLTVSVKWTCDFQNDQCTRSVTEWTYPSETLARATYEAAVEEKDEWDTTVYSYKGKVYIEDDTEDYRGTSKQEIKEEMQWYVAAYNNAK